MTEVVVVWVTAPPEEANDLAQKIVEGRWAACVNVLGDVRSVYRWKKKVETETEALLVMKTAKTRFRELQAAIRELHSYDVPEIIAMEVSAGNQEYLDWVIAETEGATTH